jgi:hypothetical protein
VVKITLFETDNVNKKDRANVKRFVQTIQHEYIHILNQTRPFDEKTLAKITPTGYTNWCYTYCSKRGRFYYRLCEIKY